MEQMILQIAQDTINTSTGKELELPLFELLIKGGWIMIPILVLAVIAVYIFIERYLTIKKAGQVDSNFMNKIRDLVMDDNIEGARNLCKEHDTPIARMIEKGLNRIGRPLKDIST
ncbi:MAG: biopolymer transporter ExbB, partial [Bacteroidetes bacterium SW_10_40_5]